MRRTHSTFARRVVCGSDLIESLEPRRLLAVSFDAPALPTVGPSSVGAAFSIAAEDFDGDSKADLAVSYFDAAGPTNFGIAYYRGHNDGTIDSPVWTPLAARSGHLAAARFPNLPVPTGGGAELVSVGGVGGDYASGFTRDFVRVFKLDIFTRQFVLEARLVVDRLTPGAGDPATIAPGAPAIADFAGDSRSDIAFAISSNGGRGIALLQHTSPGSLSLLSTFDTGYIAASPAVAGSGVQDQALTAGDLNADGRPDIVFRTTAGFFALPNSSAGLGAPVALGFASNLDWRFADIDHDGRLDALSLFTPPSQPPGPATQLHTFLRVKRGRGNGSGDNSGTFYFTTTERLSTIPIGPRYPSTGEVFALDGAVVNHRLGLIITPTLDGDTRGDIFVYRDYTASNPAEYFNYQRVETISTPAAPAAAPAWPDPQTALTAVYQHGMSPLPAALGRGIP